MEQSIHRLRRIFSPNDIPLGEDSILSKVQAGLIPPPAKSGRTIYWSETDLPRVGEQIGYLKRPRRSVVASLFVTKGGALKTTLTLNLARLAALHNVRTLVIGLDLQGDISRLIAQDNPSSEESASLQSALEQERSRKGLYSYVLNEVGLLDLIQKSNLPSLHFIPETPELIALDILLMSRPRREYWLADKVISPLKARYDLILMDCSPNWNQLTSNALVASDLLISPLECRINNFRNLELFQDLVAQCKSDLHLNFDHWFLPTRMQTGRKLPDEILSWYRAHVPQCLSAAIRESVAGEEATALGLSAIEHAPESSLAEDWRTLLRELWPTILKLADNSSSTELFYKNQESDQRKSEKPWL